MRVYIDDIFILGATKEEQNAFSECFADGQAVWIVVKRGKVQIRLTN